LAPGLNQLKEIVIEKQSLIDTPEKSNTLISVLFLLAVSAGAFYRFRK
jgi:hypothetical protein